MALIEKSWIASLARKRDNLTTSQPAVDNRVKADLMLPL
jgi:hypothetical protein